MIPTIMVNFLIEIIPDYNVFFLNRYLSNILIIMIPMFQLSPQQHENYEASPGVSGLSPNDLRLSEAQLAACAGWPSAIIAQALALIHQFMKLQLNHH